MSDKEYDASHKIFTGDIWEWRYKRMEDWLQSEYEKWTPIKDHHPSVPLTMDTLSVIYDMMKRIEKQIPQ